MEVFQAYLEAFKKCVSDYFGEDVLSDCFDGCREFRIVVLGKFVTGKSTLINAVLGEKCLKMSNLVKELVIKQIRYGESSDGNITVNYRNGDVETLSQHDYAEKLYCKTNEWDESVAKLYQKVSYVELHSASDRISRNIVFIDMPVVAFRFLGANEVLDGANAIIFTMSATQLFSVAEKEYIAENFAGKEMRNVFFVINKIDNLLEGELENNVKPYVKVGLSDVFTDSKGHFNEQLYNNRVFFTNAYGALCVRTGEPYKILWNREEMHVPMDLDDTGIPEFEEVLLSFVDEQRRERMCNLTMQLMVQIYHRLYEKTLVELKRDRCNPINYHEHNRESNIDQRMSVLQSMKDYIGYCFESLYGHRPTDLELSLMV